jgi:branched-chain amino acid transport system permease protein
MAVVRTGTQWLLLIAFLVLLFAAPQYLDNHWLRIVNLMAITVIGATGLNILVGYCGQLSIGHAGFVAVGSYTTVILATRLGFPYLTAMVCSGIVAGLVGMVFGIPSLRVKGFYLAISTIAAQFIIIWVIMHWLPVTNGINGLTMPPASIGGLVFRSESNQFYLIMVITIISVCLAKNIVRTRTGRAFIAIRDRDIAAELIGINVFKYKLVSFAISSFYAGVAGGLWCYYMTIINPEAFQLSISIDYVAMIIVGGMGTLFGSVYGAIFVVLLPEAIQRLMEVLQPVLHMEYTFAAFKQIVFGVIIVIFLVFEPKGLSEIFSRLGNRISNRKRKEAIQNGSLPGSRNTKE